MGQDRVDRLKQDYDVVVEWRAFQLRPGTPEDGAPHPYPPAERAMRRRAIQPMLDEVGLSMVDHERVPNTRKALEAAEYARDEGKFDEFHRAVFHAYFAEGRDIGEVEVLQEIASSVGLDPEELAHAIEDGRYRDRVTEDLILASRIGITGVPFFIIGNLGISGAQPYQVFEQVLTELGRVKRTTEDGMTEESNERGADG